MQIARIKYFLAVVVDGTFSEAAETLYTTQSAVSKQIIALEKELGVTLFDRTTRRVQLTAAGEVFLTYAKTMLNTFNAMNDALIELQAAQQERLHIGSIPVMAQYGVTTLIMQFQKKWGTVHLEVDERESSDLLTAMDNKEYEMAFFRTDQINIKKYQVMQLFEDQLMAVVPTSHPLANKGEISLSQLAEESFLLLSERTSLYRYCIKACERAGFTPHIIYTGTRTENIVGMVEQGMGIALLMEKPTRFVPHENTVLLPLKENLTSHISLIRLRNAKPSAMGQEFWSFVRMKTASRR